VAIEQTAKPGIWQRIKAVTRRAFTGVPSSVSPEADLAWTHEQLKVYATLQPYSSPLTTPTGGFGAGETWEMRRGYREASMREPAVKSALLTKCMAVASLDTVVKPAPGRNPQNKEAARWLDYSISSAKGGWPGLYMNMLLPALVDGYSIVEPVWSHVDRMNEDYPNWWTVSQFKGKDTEHIRFRLDTFRNIQAVQAMTAGQGGQGYNPDDFLIFTHLSFFANPFGISDLRAAFRAAFMIEGAIKLRAILLENFSGPYLVAKAKDPATRSRMMALLSQARARGWIVVPDGADIQLFNLATSAPDQFQATIRDLREEIVTAIQGAYLQLLEGGISNTRGNTQVHESVAQLFQWWLASEICEVINHRLVPDLVWPNFGKRVGLPRVTLGGIDPQAVMASLNRFKLLQEMGLDLSKEQIYEEGNAEPPHDASDILKPPANLPTVGNDRGTGDNALGFADVTSGKGAAGKPALSFPQSRFLELVDPELLAKVTGKAR
jgi:hypothetical protein